MDSDGSDDEGILCEETLADTAPYRFRITLGKHYEYESVVTILVTILHGDQPVGYLNGRVTDRSFREFHQLADGEAAELGEVGATFCNDDGTLRYRDLDGLTAREDSGASRGGFLHIEQIAIDEAHRRGDLRVRCIKALLEWLNIRDAHERQERAQASPASQPPTDTAPEATVRPAATRKPEREYVHAGWTIAVLQPGAENAEEEHARAEGHEEETEEGRALFQLFLAERAAAQRKVALQWARLGFRQARFASPSWYVTPDRLELVPIEEVAGLHISATPDKPKLAPRDTQEPGGVPLDKPLAEFFEEHGRWSKQQCPASSSLRITRRKTVVRRPVEPQAKPQASVWAKTDIRSCLGAPKPPSQAQAKAPPVVPPVGPTVGLPVGPPVGLHTRGVTPKAGVDVAKESCNRVNALHRATMVIPTVVMKPPKPPVQLSTLQGQASAPRAPRVRKPPPAIPPPVPKVEEVLPEANIAGSREKRSVRASAPREKAASAATSAKEPEATSPPAKRVTRIQEKHEKEDPPPDVSPSQGRKERAAKEEKPERNAPRTGAYAQIENFPGQAKKARKNLTELDENDGFPGQLLAIIGDTNIGQQLIQLACRKGPNGRGVGEFVGGNFKVYEKYEEQILGRLLYDPGMSTANLSRKSGKPDIETAESLPPMLEYLFGLPRHPPKHPAPKPSPARLPVKAPATPPKATKATKGSPKKEDTLGIRKAPSRSASVHAAVSPYVHEHSGTSSSGGGGASSVGRSSAGKLLAGIGGAGAGMGRLQVVTMKFLPYGIEEPTPDRTRGRSLWEVEFIVDGIPVTYHRSCCARCGSAFSRFLHEKRKYAEFRVITDALSSGGEDWEAFRGWRLCEPCYNHVLHGKGTLNTRRPPIEEVLKRRKEAGFKT